MGKNTYLVISKCLLNVMFYCGIPVTVSVPFLFKWYGKINSYYQEYYLLQTVLFVISGVLACMIIYELRRMIRSVEQENCFVMQNVKSLKSMGNYSFIIAAVSLFYTGYTCRNIGIYHSRVIFQSACRSI